MLLHNFNSMKKTILIVNIVILIACAPVLLLSLMPILFCDVGPISTCVAGAGAVASIPTVGIVLVVISFIFLNRNIKVSKILTILATVLLAAVLIIVCVILLLSTVPLNINHLDGPDQPVTTNQIVVPTSAMPSTSVDVTAHDFGIMTATFGGNATVNKAVIAQIGTSSSSPAKTQSNTVFDKGNEYAMYFSGVSGFTLNHPYGAKAGFVDAHGSITLYDANNTVVFSEPDIFASYVGGVPAADFAYLTFKINLNKNFQSGNYRWESVVTDAKDSNNYIKGVVNFSVK